MRTVAQKCGIALGTLYNYYADKNELLLATVGSVWEDIFHGGDCSGEECESFPDHVEQLYRRIRSGLCEYPDFFTLHSISIANSVKGKAKGIMEQYLGHIKKGFSRVLEGDKNVKKSVFSADFSKERFEDFVFDNIMLNLARDRKDCRELTEIIRRVIY